MVCYKYREQTALYLPLLLCSAFNQLSDFNHFTPVTERVVLTRKNILQKMKFQRNCWRTHYVMFLTTLIVTVTHLLLEIGKIKFVHPSPSYSYSEQSDDDDETLDSAVSTLVITDKTPNLGPFTGNRGVKQIPSDPTKISQVTGLLLGDTFFDMLCEETNRYYLQNQEKYVTGSKGLKWSDVTVAEKKKFFSIKKKRNSVHLQVLFSATPQGGMFPEVSHPQALLGTLVSIS